MNFNVHWQPRSKNTTFEIERSPRQKQALKKWGSTQILRYSDLRSTRRREKEVCSLASPERARDPAQKARCVPCRTKPFAGPFAEAVGLGVTQLKIQKGFLRPTTKPMFSFPGFTDQEKAHSPGSSHRLPRVAPRVHMPPAWITESLSKGYASSRKVREIPLRQESSKIREGLWTLCRWKQTNWKGTKSFNDVNSAGVLLLNETVATDTEEGSRQCCSTLTKTGHGGHTARDGQRVRNRNVCRRKQRRPGNDAVNRDPPI
jgi:hypothetical protein